MTVPLNLLTWRLMCVCILVYGQASGFALLGGYTSLPLLPEPETTPQAGPSTTATATATTTVLPVPTTSGAIVSGSQPEVTTSSAASYPESVRSALQLLKNYVLTKQGPSSVSIRNEVNGQSHVPKSVNGQGNVPNDVSLNIGPLSSPPMTQNGGLALPSLPGNFANMPANPVLPFGKDSTSSFNSVTGSFVGTGPQINQIPTSQDGSLSEYISQISEGQEGQLTDILNTLRALQTASHSKNNADVEAPESGAPNQEAASTAQATVHQPNCPFANTNHVSTAQIQSQTGLVLPVDQPSSLAEPQQSNNNPAGTEQSRDWGNNPNQVHMTSNDVANSRLATGGFGTQQIQTGPRITVGTQLSLVQQAGVNSQSSPTMRTADPSSLQNWNSAPTQNNAARNSLSSNGPMSFSQLTQGSQSQNTESFNTPTNSFLSGNTDPLGPGNPGSRYSPSFSPGSSPDPRLPIFQPIFGEPPAKTNAAEQRGSETVQVRPNVGLGAVIQPDTPIVMSPNSGPDQNPNQQTTSQLSQIMSGQASDIATYYQTAEGKLIRVIPYQKPSNSKPNVNNPIPQSSATTQDQNAAVKPTQSQLPRQFARFQTRNPMRNIFANQGRSLRQFQDLRSRRQYPMYQNGRSISVYRRGNYPGGQALRYPVAQQRRGSSPSNLIQNQRAQFPQAPSNGQVGRRSDMAVTDGNGNLGPSSPTRSIMQVTGINQMIDSQRNQQISRQQLTPNQNIQQGMFMVPQSGGVPFSLRENMV